ncbi:MAG: ATP-binding protein [Chloroflexota bacterium]
MTSTLTVDGDYSCLTVVCDFAQNFAIKAGFDSRSVYAVQMAVDEAVSNIIEHGYGGEGKGKIHLDFVQLQDSIKVTIQDEGTPFDPDAIPLPDFYAPIKDRPEGGLGLYLMRKLMDQVEFNFSSDRNQEMNTLTMIKHLNTST